MGATNPGGAATSDASTLRLGAHALAALLAAFAVALAILTWGKVQLLETLFHLLTGGFGLALTYASWRRQRAAWAFLTMLNAVQSVFTLFGAPSEAEGLGTPMATMLAISFLYAVSATLLALLRRDYQTRE